MGRTGKPWTRNGRPGFFATIDGRQVFLALERKEAEREFHRLKLEETPRPVGKYSVPDLVEIYLEEIADQIKPKTYKNYYEALQTWGKDHASIAPKELRAFHLTRWLKKHTEWKQSMRKLQGSIVKMWSAWADGEGYIDGDRLRKARLPESIKRDAADPDELVRIERTITDPYFLAYWVVLYDTGARPGEIASLEASAINWSTSTAVVDGKRGQRIIGVSARSVEWLRAAFAQYPEGPILRTSHGALWSENVRRNHLEKWKARTEPRVDAALTLYHCRHDLYRRWHAAGVADVIISRQMGHTLRGAPSLSLLVGVYAHSDASALALAAQSACQAALTSSKPRSRKA